MTDRERAAIKAALECLEWHLAQGAYGCDIEGTVALLRDVLGDKTLVSYGCHVDLCDGDEPDGCVLDDGRHDDCAVAVQLVRQGKTKTDCEYWQPIKVVK